MKTIGLLGGMSWESTVSYYQIINRPVAERLGGRSMDTKGEPVNASDIVEIEAIRQLKARYFRFLDTKQWDAWREVFTEDFRGEIHGPHPVIHYENRDEMVDAMREILAEAPTVHHGHMPEIELTGPDTAMGIWAMVDVVKLGAGFVGYGHYHEEYRKVEGDWRIARLRLTRLHIEAAEPAAG